MRKHPQWLLPIIAAAIACSGQKTAQAAPESASPELAVRLAQEMAAAGSRLDVATLNTFIPQTDRIVYVSDTNPISGNAYRKTLGDFYATLSKLDYKWTKWETYPISENAVGFTGWADITTVTLKGVTEHDRAIVSMVFARDSTGGWKRIIAHKSTILPAAPPPPTRAR
jgi:hypothetical protein